MKTTTLNIKTKLAPFKGMILSLAMFTTVAATAQLQNNGQLYISDKGVVFLATGNYGFGASPAKSVTTRTVTDFGKLVLASGTTSSGATTSHYIDGYARTLDASPYILYLGQSGVLAPINVDASTTDGVTAAFYKVPPTNSTSLGTGLSMISDNENWDIQGVASKISLSWRAATIANLTSSLYTIVGYKISTGKWEIIPSTVDATSFLGGTSSPVGGSITSTDNVTLSDYSRFTIGSKGENCGDVVTFSGTTLTWTASGWQNAGAPSSAPTIADKVIISSSAAAPGSFSCYSMVLDADLTLAENQFVDCYDGVTGSSKIIMASNANFIQRTNTEDVPTIELNKETRVIRRYDYIYWGTPISENLIAQFPTARANSTPTAAAGAFDLLYKYNSGQTEGVTVWGPITASEVGRGFIARVRNQAPFTNTTNTDYIDFKISGTANNGDISVSIIQNEAAPNGNSSYNLLSNPYPSGLDASKFITENSTAVDGAIYLWTSSTLFNPTGGPTNYSQADYLTYTRMGTTVTNSSTTFDGIVASGQGFTTKALADTDAIFNNCMRVKEGNTQFLKSSNTVAELDRYKINMTGANGVFSQILVGYTPETTLEYDRMYDATRNSVSTAKVYTFLDNTDTKLAINARPTFDNTDVVELGLSKNNTNAETFVFEITDKEGVFNTGDVNVYLHDKTLGTYHNFALGNYTLTTSDSAIDDRFELVYQTEGQLSSPDFDGATTLVYLNENIFKVNSTKTISSIAIYDMAGRLVSNFTDVENTMFTSSFNKAQGVYIAKIILVDGSIVNQKVINQ